MTTLPNDPPADDDDWSHEQLEQDNELAADPDDLEAYSDEELEAFADEDADEITTGGRVSYPGEDVDETADEDEI
jgi:hypothetical protein